MRNRWGVELKKGLIATAHLARGGQIEDRIKSVKREAGRGYVVTLDSGVTVAADDVVRVNPDVHIDIGSHNTSGRGNTAKNPTPRIPRKKLNTQPSQATGEAPSKRLQVRRKKTNREAMPGIWANPLTRVRVMDEPSRGGELTERLKTRRKTTKKSPAGFYANPKARALYIVWQTARDGIKHQSLAMFESLKLAREYAQAYADAHGASVAIETKRK